MRAVATDGLETDPDPTAEEQGLEKQDPHDRDHDHDQDRDHDHDHHDHEVSETQPDEASIDMDPAPQGQEPTDDKEEPMDEAREPRPFSGTVEDVPDRWFLNNYERFGTVQVGAHPYVLIDQMKEDNPLKEVLEECVDGLEMFWPSNKAVAHRGAAMHYPEHTRQSYIAAGIAGAGVLECDVSYTKDHNLVCRTSQCDLADTTNVMRVPELREKCRKPFVPATGEGGKDETGAKVKCCTSDFTLEELKSLCARPYAGNPGALKPGQYMPDAQTEDAYHDPYNTCGEIVSHAESIVLFQSFGAQFTPELLSQEFDKDADSDDNTITHDDIRKRIVQDYIDAGVPPEEVFLQSAYLEDIEFWIEHFPEYGQNAVFVDDRMARYKEGWEKHEETVEAFEALTTKGIRTVSPGMPVLLDLDEDGKLVPSTYAKNAQEAGLQLVTWTHSAVMNYSVPKKNGEDEDDEEYEKRLTKVLRDPAQAMDVLDVLFQDVGIIRIQSDMPADVVFYDNCTQQRPGPW